MHTEHICCGNRPRVVHQPQAPAIAGHARTAASLVLELDVQLPQCPVMAPCKQIAHDTADYDVLQIAFGICYK